MTALPTHALYWLPPYLITGSDHGWWELQDLDEFEAGGPPAGSAVALDAPRAADPAGLAQWVSTRLGHQVRLTSSKSRVRLRWRPWWRNEPAYYVISAKEQS